MVLPRNPRHNFLLFLFLWFCYPNPLTKFSIFLPSKRLLLLSPPRKILVPLPFYEYFILPKNRLSFLSKIPFFPCKNPLKTPIILLPNPLNTSPSFSFSKRLVPSFKSYNYSSSFIFTTLDPTLSLCNPFQVIASK